MVVLNKKNQLSSPAETFNNKDLLNEGGQDILTSTNTKSTKLQSDLEKAIGFKEGQVGIPGVNLFETTTKIKPDIKKPEVPDPTKIGTQGIGEAPETIDTSLIPTKEGDIETFGEAFDLEEPSELQKSLQQQVDVTKKEQENLERQRLDILSRFEGEVSLDELKDLNKFELLDKIKELELKEKEKADIVKSFEEEMDFQERSQKRRLSLFDQKVEDLKLDFKNKISDSREQARINNENALKVSALTGTSFSTAGMAGLDYLEQQGNNLISRLESARDSALSSLTTQREQIVDEFNRQVNSITEAQSDALNKAKTDFLAAAFEIDADLDITTQQGLNNLIKIKDDFLDRQNQIQQDAQNQILFELNTATKTFDLLDKQEERQRNIATQEFDRFADLENLQNVTTSDIIQFAKRFPDRAGEIARNLTQRQINNTGIGIDSALEQFGIKGYSFDPEVQARIQKGILEEGKTPNQVATEIIGELKQDKTKFAELQELGLTESEKLKREKLALDVAEFRAETLESIGEGNVTSSEGLKNIISYSVTKRGKENLQCGELVNDYWTQLTGSRAGMGDTYQSKINAVENIGKSETPVAGGVFVNNPLNNTVGHTGIVQSVNPDGSITVLEANIQGSGKGGLPELNTYTADQTKNMVFSQAPKEKVIEVTPTDVMTFNSSTFKPQSDLKTSEDKAKYKQFLKEKSNIMDEKDASMEDILKYSAGGKDLTDTSIKSLEKFDTVVNQLGNIQEQISEMETGPVIGKLAGLNPYDVDAQTLKAQLTSLIPALARGVYGEVGVLTDNDIRLYSQTIPNLTSTQEVNEAILAMTLKTVAGGYKKQLQTLAAAGKDVSGFSGLYDNLNSQVEALEGKLGITSGEAPVDKITQARDILKRNKNISIESSAEDKLNFLNQ